MFALILGGCGSGSSGPEALATTSNNPVNSNSEPTYSGPTNSEPITSEIVSTLVVATKVGDPSTDNVVLGAITSDLLTSNGIEAVGCWFHDGEGTAGDVLFFSGYDGGFFLIDGKLVRVEKPNGKSFGVEVGLTYRNDDFQAKFSGLGQPVASSIESTEQDATLDITPTNGTTSKFGGTLWCGV